jgi:hypothetical protein
MAVEPENKLKTTVLSRTFFDHIRNLPILQKKRRRKFRSIFKTTGRVSLFQAKFMPENK